MNPTRHFILAAGGTGGHMIPAHALADELMRRGHRVMLVSDERGVRFPGLFEGVQTHILPAGRIGGGPLGMVRAARNILAGRARARVLCREFEPTAVIGFGGYPALPTLLAALAEHVPTVIHEQNAVLGRVNRYLSGKVDAIATAYGQVERLRTRLMDKVALVGNPVREEVRALRDLPYPALDEKEPLRILVTGGSQGATILSRVVPQALELLPPALRRRIEIVQQCRAEDIEAVRSTYAGIDVRAELATYLPDLPQRIGWSHLVIGRAGASTMAELTTMGRPAILVPYPSATDDHQTANAREMVAAGGGWLMKQPAFTASAVAELIEMLARDPAKLIDAAAAARAVGRPEAAERLADLVESFGRTPVVDAIVETRQRAAKTRYKGAYA